MKKDTLLITTGRNPCGYSGTVNPPIHMTSTIIFPTLQDYHAAEKGKSCYAYSQNTSTSDPSYGIAGTPTTFALQEALVSLEGGDKCTITSSGLSAITHSLMAFLESGDHLLMVDSVYGPTRRFCNKHLKKFGIDVTYYNPRIGADINSLVQENTKIIFMESPGSQTFEIQDVPAIVGVAKQHNIVTMLDNSWATPLFFNPISLGVDIVIHAITKYICGHSDLLMGAIIAKGDDICRKILKESKISGACVSPFDCSLALRGMRSLSARMQKHQRSTSKVIDYLKTESKVQEILYPADESSPDYELWKQQFSGASSLFTLVLDKQYDYDVYCKFINSLELFGIGASWGGYESLVLDCQPVRTATKWERSGSCVRFYIGLEDPDDLICDMQQAFEQL